MFMPLATARELSPFYTKRRAILRRPNGANVNSQGCSEMQPLVSDSEIALSPNGANDFRSAAPLGLAEMLLESFPGVPLRSTPGYSRPPLRG